MSDWKRSVYSDGSENFVSPSRPGVGDKVEIRLRVLKTADLKAVRIELIQNGCPVLLKMQKKSRDEFYQYYAASVVLRDVRLRYYFVLLTGDEQIFYYQQNGLHEYLPDERANFCLLVDFDGPDWLQEQVFYQIFPDRFFGAVPEITPADGAYDYCGFSVQQREWSQKPLEWSEGGCLDFFGGDLEGIRQKIPYLQDLGISAIYLNPIFSARTHHRYDCIDYFSVDVSLGGDEALEKLRTEMQDKGLRLILDISVNHTGTAHRWFNREGLFGADCGAFHNPEGLEADYYVRTENGAFHRWEGVDSLVTLDFESESLRKIIYGDGDSVLQHWLKPPFCIDGWRFDVGHCMAKEGEPETWRRVWREIRSILKLVNPDCFLLAEHWDDASDFLQGDMWDSAMNYFGFLRPLRRFFGENDWKLRHSGLKKNRRNPCSAEQLDFMLQNARSSLPFQLMMQQFNLLSSHDIHRFYSPKGFTVQQYRAAMSILLTYPGVPSVYYGDEQMLSGHCRSVEGCRYPMLWTEDMQNNPSYGFCRDLVHLRRKARSLARGGFKTLMAEGGVFAYARFWGDECVITVCSMENTEKELLLPIFLAGDFCRKKTFYHLHDNEKQEMRADGFLPMSLAPQSSMVLYNFLLT